MASVIKGHATCPECGSKQEVKHDTRKFYINCAECRTMTSYQSKAAQARILERMTVATDEPQLKEPETKKIISSEPRPAKPARANDSFFDALNDLF